MADYTYIIGHCEFCGGTMKKQQFVSDLVGGADVSEIFLVKYIALAEGRDGRTYLNITFGDSTGDIEAKKWQGAEDTISKISRGDYVIVAGKINSYQNRLQLIIKDINTVSAEEVDRNDFIIKSQNSLDEMFDRLLSIVHRIDNVYLRDLVSSVLADRDIVDKFKLWPAGRSVHHNYEGGLLEHTLSCVTIAESLAPHYNVDKNYCVAGLVLHDICKIYELGPLPMADYTDEGKLIGHLPKALEIVDHFSLKIKNFPHWAKIHLKHILLSHHGEVQFGSPKSPQTAEAYLVHLIDLMDSRMGAIEAIKKGDRSGGKWSGYVKHFDGIVFKEMLPHYSSYLDLNSSDSKKVKTSTKDNGVGLTHSMADKLAGFKIEE